MHDSLHGEKIMLDWLDELLNALRAEAALYRQLLEIMSRERTALVRSRRMDLEACSSEKRQLIERLEAAGQRRAEVVRRLAGHLDRPAAEVTLRLLAQTAPEPQRGKLQQARAELLELVAQAKAENQRSELLCRHIGELLRAAYGMAKGLAANGFVYHRGGRLERAPLNGKLVCDEI
jgi:flagellar biosynthesis/type III secretory pathway chaperone